MEPAPVVETFLPRWTTTGSDKFIPGFVAFFTNPRIYLEGLKVGWYNGVAVNDLPAASLRVENLVKLFGTRRVLRGISFEASGGEVVVVTGSNGSGKSTLLRIVAGLLRPSRGQVALALGGEELAPEARRRAVGYAAPDLALYPELTGAENLSFFSRVRGLPLGTDALQGRLDAVGLGGRGGDLVGAYSSGMRQRLRLAFALLATPAVLLLDEPSLALDAAGVALVGEIVRARRARGGLTLLATNDPREAGLGDRALALGG
jgi:heme exporter protein A